MLVPLGLWLGIIGYGVLYSGVIKLGGGSCSLAQAFRGQCQPAAAAKSGPAVGGATLGSRRAAAASMHFNALPRTARLAV
jgi:hypothetical protein